MTPNTERSDLFLETANQTRDVRVQTPSCPRCRGTDCIFQMFWSVLSQQRFDSHCMTCTVYLSLPSSFSICLFSCLFCAQPHKLTDSHKGHSVIRWKQYPSRSGPTAFSLIFMLLPSHMHVINTTVSALRRCLRHAGTWLPSLSVHGPHLLLLPHLQVLQKGRTPHFYSIYAVSKIPNAALFLFFVWRSSKISHFVLTSQCSGWVQIKKNKSHLFTEKCVFNSFDASWYCLGHCTIK